jgi:hypothetical protein
MLIITLYQSLLALAKVDNTTKAKTKIKFYEINIKK